MDALIANARFHFHKQLFENQHTDVDHGRCRIQCRHQQPRLKGDCAEDR